MCDFYEDGLKFECNGCSYCCRFEGGVVLLCENDLERLAEFSGLKKEEFIEVYCRYEENDSGEKFLVLKVLSNGDCIFWNKDLCGGKGGCECYEARPVQCSTYPFWTKILASEDAWNAEAAKCPGINFGTLRAKEEIEDQLELYRARVPLLKKALFSTTSRA